MLKTIIQMIQTVFRRIPVFIIPLIIVLTFCFPVQADELVETDESTDEIWSSGDWSSAVLNPSSQQIEINRSDKPQTVDLKASTSTLFSDGFEGSFPGNSWTVTYNPAGSAWGATTYKAHTGSRSVWCAGADMNPASSNYPEENFTWMYIGPFDLSDVSAGSLDLYYWMRTQLVTNHDASTGDLFFIFANTSTSGYWYGPGYSGTQTSWQKISLDLTDWYFWDTLCGRPSVYFAFVFSANGDSITDKGVFLDDVNLKIKTTNPPVAPYNLEAEAISSKQVNLTWSEDSNDESGFKVERRKEVEANFKEIKSLPANTTTYTDKSGLSAATSYVYRVCAYNADSKSDYTEEAYITTLTDPPSVPKLAAPKNGATKVGLTPVLSWTEKGEAESYLVQIAKDTKFTTLVMDDAAFGETFYEVQEGLLNWNNKYYWRVAAQDQTGSTSDWSSVFNFKTADGPAPDPPSDLEGEALSSRQVNLSWSDNSENESGFYIERKKDTDANFKQIAKVKTDINTYQDKKGLTVTTTYFYRVRAYNTTGDSGYSDEIEVTTLTEPPSAPVLTSPKKGAKKITTAPLLTWNAPRKGEAEIYFVQVASDSKFTDLLVNDSIGPETEYGIGDENLEWKTKYYWHVSAQNAEGSTSAWSSTFDFTTADGPAPEPPSDLEGEAIAWNQVWLWWYDSSEDETGFYLERKKSSESKFKQVAKIAADVEEYTDSRLSANTEYEYRIRAYNSNADSEYSESLIITTWPSPPGVPTLLLPASGAKVADLIVELTWKVPTKGEVSYYELQVDVSSKFLEPLVDESDIIDTSFEVDVPDWNTTYYWHVRAVDSYGQASAWSSSRSFKTPAEE